MRFICNIYWLRLFPRYLYELNHSTGRYWNTLFNMEVVCVSFEQIAKLKYLRVLLITQTLLIACLPRMHWIFPSILPFHGRSVFSSVLAGLLLQPSSQCLHPTRSVVQCLTATVTATWTMSTRHVPVGAITARRAAWTTVSPSCLLRGTIGPTIVSAVQHRGWVPQLMWWPSYFGCS